MKPSELPQAQTLKLPQVSVDECLANAALESKSQVSMKNFSVRLPTSLKDEAQEICARHGTDLGTVLRECTRALVAGYRASEPTQE